MIEAMQHVSLIALDGDREDVLLKLGELGIMHVELDVSKAGQPPQALVKNMAVLKEIQNDFEKLLKKNKLVTHSDIQIAVEEILTIHRDFKQCELELKHLDEEINLWQPWGNINLEWVRELQGQGIFSHCCWFREKELKKLPKHIFVHKLFKKNESWACLCVSLNTDWKTSHKQDWPERSLREMKARRLAMKMKFSQLQKQYEKAASSMETVQRNIIQLEMDVELLRVRASIDSKENFSYLQGYCPSNQIGTLNRVASSMGFAVITREPRENEKPPTLLKLNSCLNWIKPIMKLMNILPGYREFDISGGFFTFSLPFLFHAYC